MIRVLIVDDEALIRKGLKFLLNDIKGIRVVGEAATGAEAMRLAQQKQPNVVILDLRLPDTNGMEVARKLLRRMPDVKLLVLTALRSDALIGQLLDAGVHGYMTKASSRNELEHAIRVVNSGQRYLGPHVATRTALNKVTGKGRTLLDELSSREMEILLLIVKGMNAEAIAKKLFISPKTVNSYRYRMFEKLGVHNDVGLVMLAIRYGLVEVDRI